MTSATTATLDLSASRSMGLRLNIETSFGNPGRDDAVTLRLTMADGSLWDNVRPLPYPARYTIDYRFECQNATCDPSILNWYRVPWGPVGSFDKNNMVAWEIILGSPPVGEHSVTIESLTVERLSTYWRPPSKRPTPELLP